MSKLFRSAPIRRLTASVLAAASFVPSVSNPQFSDGLIDSRTAEAANSRQISQYPWGGEIDAQEIDGTYIYQASNNKFYERSMPGGVLNLGWFLGSGDNYPKVQGLIDFLIRTGAGNRRINVVVPPGNYYFSKTLVMHSLQLVISGLGATFSFPGGIRMLEIRRMNRHEFFTISYLTLSATSFVDNDGYIDSNDGTYAEYLMRAMVYADDRSRGGEGYYPAGTGITVDPQPVVKIKSLRAQDFKNSGIYANTPVTLDHVEVERASGCGIQLDGTKIYPDFYAPDAFAPYGYNVSLSKLYGGECRGCGGPGLAIYGSDGSQCTVDSWSCRNNWVNFLSDCQEGNRFLTCHASSSQWGNYMMVGVSSGDDVFHCYSEGDSTINKFCGYTVVTGGRMDRNDFRQGIFAQVNQASRTSSIFIGSLGVGGAFRFGRFNQTIFNKSLTWSEDNTRGIHEIISLMGRSAASKRGGLPFGSASLSALIGDVLFASCGSIQEFLAQYPARCQRSDDITLNRVWDTYGPRKYTCVQEGMSGPVAYKDLEGCILTHADAGTQNFYLDKPSSVFTLYDTLIVNGTPCQITNGRVNENHDYTYISFHYPGVRLNGQPGIVEYPKPEFRAVSGGASGPSDQRPTARMRPVDKGFEYYDETLKKPIFWDGAVFRDSQGIAV